MDEEKLTRDTIVDEAIRLINDDGLDGVSLRKLAERVGVKAPSLSLRMHPTRGQGGSDRCEDCQTQEIPSLRSNWWQGARYGKAYQVERPPPWRTSSPFSTMLLNVALSVFALAPYSRTMSRVATRP